MCGIWFGRTGLYWARPRKGQAPKIVADLGKRTLGGEQGGEGRCGCCRWVWLVGWHGVNSYVAGGGDG